VSLTFSVYDRVEIIITMLYLSHDRKEFLNKTIWIKFTANNMKFLLINVHLKASVDELSKNIRELEGTLVQLMLKNLLESEGCCYRTIECLIATDFL